MFPCSAGDSHNPDERCDPPARYATGQSADFFIQLFIYLLSAARRSREERTNQLSHPGGGAPMIYDESSFHPALAGVSRGVPRLPQGSSHGRGARTGGPGMTEEMPAPRPAPRHSVSARAGTRRHHHGPTAPPAPAFDRRTGAPSDLPSTGAWVGLLAALPVDPAHGTFTGSAQGVQRIAERPAAPIRSRRSAQPAGPVVSLSDAIPPWCAAPPFIAPLERGPATAAEAAERSPGPWQPRAGRPPPPRDDVRS